MLSRQFQENLGEISSAVAPRAAALEQRYKALLGAMGFSGEHESGLTAITLGAASQMLSRGQSLADFLEHVEYRGRRLAKLGMTPAEVVSALRQLEDVLPEVLGEDLISSLPALEWVRNQLHFLVVVTLNNAFYQVREAESHAFYELFRVEVESRSVEDLLPRLLKILMEYTGADAGELYLVNEHSGQWSPAAVAPERAGYPFEPPASLVARLSEPFCLPLEAKKRTAALALDAEWAGRFKTCWSVPMLAENRLRGVLQFGFLKVYQWLPRELELLLAAAERCWMAVEKAQLMHDLARREEQVRQLAEHMVDVEESERKRISRELHDEAGQSLLCVRLQMEMIEQDAASPLSAAARQKLADTKELVEHTIVEIRRLIAALSPAILDQMGLAAALRQLVHRFRRLHPNTNVRLSMPRRAELPRRMEIIVYRLLQEVFNNIGKYSLARNVNLSMDSADGFLRLHVEDDGVGFDVDQAFARRDTFGLSGMRERVALLGGTLQVISRQVDSPGRETGETGVPSPRRKQAQGRVGVDRPGTSILVELPLEGALKGSRRKPPAKPAKGRKPAQR